MADDTPIYDRESLPEDFDVPGGAAWATFTLKEPLRAIRIEGAFQVRLPLGHALRDDVGALTCEDGWLAIDQNGDPFPIANEQFEAIYHPSGGTFTAKPSEMDDAALGAAVEKRFGSWLDIEDIRMLLAFIDGDVDGAGLEELGTLEKLRKIEERAA